MNQRAASSTPLLFPCPFYSFAISVTFFKNFQGLENKFSTKRKFNLDGPKLQYLRVSTVILVYKYWTLAKLKIAIVSCKNVRIHMAFSYNNSYNDFAIANRFMNFLNLSGFAPCQGKNEIVLLTHVWPIACGALLNASATDTPPIPGIGRYCVMYHAVIVNYRYLDQK